MAQRHRLLATLLVVVLILIPLASPEVTRAQNNDELIRMTVTVWNDKGLIKGLTREAFQLKDDKSFRPIEFFEAGDAAISIGIVVDLSSTLQMIGWSGKRDRWPSQEISQFIQSGNRPMSTLRSPSRRRQSS
jgi:hypothetical protein